MTQPDINSSANRHWLYGFNVALLIIIAVTILCFACYLTNRFNHHSDWTKSGLYSLSGSTKNMLHDAASKNQTYELVSLFRPGTEHERQVMDLLDEYARASSAIKIQDASDTPLEDIQKRVRTLYSGELKPYQQAVDAFDPLADELNKFFKDEAANIGAVAQKPGVSPAGLHDAQQLQGSFNNDIPSAIGREQRAIRNEAESTTPNYSKAVDNLKAFADSISAPLNVFTNPKELKDQFSPEMAAYFTSVAPRYQALLAKVQAFKDQLAKLKPLKVQDLLDTLQTGQDNILVIGPAAAKIVAYSDIYKSPNGNPDSEQFNGEQALSSALLSLERPDKVKVVFITATPQRYTTPGGPFSEIADALRDSNFDVLEWSPPGPPTNPNEPPPSPTPPAEGSGVVWIVFPPDAPNPQMMMMGMPPPDPRPVIEAARAHLAAGGSVLFLAEASSGFMGATSGYAYADLLKPYGVDVQSKYTAVRQIQQQDPRTGDMVNQVIPVVMIDRYSDDQITRPLQSLTTVFAPLNSQQGGYMGLPTVVAKSKTIPAGVEVNVLMETPKSPDTWGESQLQADAKFDAATDLASPLPLAVSAIRNKGQAGKESRIVVIGSKVFAANPFLDEVRPVMIGNEIVPVQAYPGNTELLRNSALWLAGYENMIAVSAKANAALRIGDISPTALTTIRVIFFYVGLPFAALIIGGIVWLIRRK